MIVAPPMHRSRKNEKVNKYTYMICTQYYLCTNHVGITNFELISYFISYCLIKKYEFQVDFCLLTIY